MEKDRQDISGQFGNTVPEDALVIAPLENRAVEPHWLSGTDKEKDQARMRGWIRERKRRKPPMEKRRLLKLFRGKK